MAETFTLHFPDIVRVAGEIVQGHVELNLRKALDEKVENVRIKLRGSIVTYVLLFRVHSKSQISLVLRRKITETKHEYGPDGPKNETHYKTQTVQVKCPTPFINTFLCFVFSFCALTNKSGTISTRHRAPRPLYAPFKFSYRKSCRRRSTIPTTRTRSLSVIPSKS
jgi:hypothetical protein